MNNSAKEQKIGCDVVCKSHSARTERDLYRICPSKLSKRELEDLYFALLENNLELKKTINVQQDKIKVFSTRLMRMTVVQKNIAGKEKDCCASKAVVSEQRESITDLKKTNERMAERIRLLNMRLCSAKQFLKRSPSQSTNSYKTCTRCSFRNSSLSALNAKKSDSNMRTTAVSCQFLDKDVSDKITRSVETETEPDIETPEKKDPEKLCNENKCRTVMDELKEKISNLQQELATSHNEYSQRIAKLELLVSELHDENLRARSDHVASEHALQQRVKKADQLQDKLRTSDAKCTELNMELAIEKRKVTELETGLKLANMSKHVLETIEQLAAAKEENPEPTYDLTRVASHCSSCSQKNEELISSSKANLDPQSSSKTKNEVQVTKSDDSGYTELNKSCETDDDQVMVKMNRELLNRIAELQTKLDIVKISAAGAAVDNKQNKKQEDIESYDVETKDVDETQIQDAGKSASLLVNVDSEKSNSNGPHTASERDRAIAPGGYEASTSKPWEDYLITGRNANVEETTDNDNVDRPVDNSIFMEKPEAARDDDHNSFQIPGPIPAVNPSQSNSTDKRKNYRNGQNSKDSYNDRLKKKSNLEEKAVKIFENSKESYFTSDKQSCSTVGGRAKDPTIIANLKEYARDIEAERKNKDVDKKQKNVSITDVAAKLADRTPTRDSIFVNRKKMNCQSEDGATMAEVKKESTTSFYLESVCTPPASHNSAGASADVLLSADSATQVEDNVNMYGTHMESASGANRRDSATYTADAPNTYTVQVEKRSRATSPDNTDHEISSMTDLPSEKYDKSPSTKSGDGSPRAVLSHDALSPGEERATVTSSYTETLPTDSGSLSVGELPGGKVRRLSVGERPLGADTTRSPLAGTSSEKMEATLQSISDELARCRQLLLTQRPAEVILYSSAM